MAEVTRFWWVRHGPSIGPGLIGATDAPADLSDTAALARLRDRLPREGLALTSGMRRARQTCAAIRSDGWTDAPVASPLREQDFGAWEGLDWDTINDRHAAAAERFWADPAGAVPPGGESFAAVSARARGWIIEAPAAPDMVIVAHAGPIRAALGLALDLPPGTALRFDIKPLSCTRIDRIRAGGAIHWGVGCVNAI